jgi:hypothetical protein
MARIDRLTRIPTRCHLSDASDTSSPLDDPSQKFDDPALVLAIKVLNVSIRAMAPTGA